MIYKFFRYWFLLIAGSTLLYTINFMQETKLAGGYSAFFAMAVVPLLVSIIVVSLCLAIFVASPKKVDSGQSNNLIQKSGVSLDFEEIAKLSVLGVASVISAYFFAGFLL